MRRLIDACFNVGDDEMFALLTLLDATEGVRLETSAVAGPPGAARLGKRPSRGPLALAFLTP
jgi:D-serine dehydratase